MGHGGRELTAQFYQRLEEIGEEEIFEIYLDCGLMNSKKKDCLLSLLEELFDLKISTRPLYGWLHLEDGLPSPNRWDRWQEVRKQVAQQAADDVITIAENMDRSTVYIDQHKIKVKQWVAERFDREGFGKLPRDAATTNVNVQVSTGSAWLEAISQPVEQIEEADVEVIEVVEPQQLTGGSDE